MVSAPLSFGQTILDLKDAAAFARGTAERLRLDEREIAALRLAVLNAGDGALRRGGPGPRRSILDAAVESAQAIDPARATAHAAKLLRFAEAADRFAGCMANAADPEQAFAQSTESARRANEFAQSVSRIRAAAQATVDRNNEIIETLQSALATLGRA